jgi:hypothetical protein
MSETNPREIKNLGMLDLTGMKSPDELNNISTIQNVGVIIVPQSLTSKLASIPQENVGMTLPVPDGKAVKVNMIMGPLQTTGEALVAQDGEDDRILVVMGPLVITTPVAKLGYSQITVMGPVLAPKGSEAAFSTGNFKIMGPLNFYPYGPNVKAPRMFNGIDRLSADFFNLLKEPMTMIVNGHVVVEPDVTVELFRSKVSEIFVNGMLEGPKALVPLMQVLTTEKNGAIQASGE